MKMQHLRRRFLHSTTAKTSMTTVLLVIVVLAGFAVVTGIVKLPNIDLSQWGLGVSTTGGAGVDVNKQLQFTFTNKYSGAASASKTFYVYEGSTLLESLTTTSDGLKNTAKQYESGTVLNIKYVDGNAKLWYQVTVPKMNAADAQSATYNNIDLDTFSVGTWSDAISSLGIAYATNYAYDNGTTPTFQYEVTNTGADNTGMMDSAIVDPVYGQAYQTWLVVTISGTDYEKITMNGFDQVLTLGQTQYGIMQVNPAGLTKYKVGNNYQLGMEGDLVLHFGIDMTGYTTKAATMTIYLYAYADGPYGLSHGGQFGTGKYQISTASLVLYGS